MIKSLSFQIHTLILNMHALNSVVLKHIKEKLTELKGEIDRSIIIAGDFNTLSVIDNSNRKSARIQNCGY